MITFILCADGFLSEPLLYLSLYFKVNKQSYYDHLQYVRETGDLEEWLQFFLKGIIYTAEQSVQTIQRILSLLDGDRKKIQTMGKAGPRH